MYRSMDWTFSIANGDQIISATEDSPFGVVVGHAAPLVEFTKALLHLCEEAKTLDHILYGGVVRQRLESFQSTLFVSHGGDPSPCPAPASGVYEKSRKRAMGRVCVCAPGAPKMSAVREYSRLPQKLRFDPEVGKGKAVKASLLGRQAGIILDCGGREPFAMPTEEVTRVKKRAHIVKMRRLPLKGQVVAKKGDHVKAETVVACTEPPGNVQPVKAAS
jgi:hypothetical protein